jgi:hypothetical protein
MIRPDVDRYQSVSSKGANATNSIFNDPSLWTIKGERLGTHIAVHSDREYWVEANA